MKKYLTVQEKFWSGPFGDKYTNRNTEQKYLAKNIALFSEILKGTQQIKSVIEFGSNIGLNLKAIETLLPNSEFAAIEINTKAVNTLKKNINCIKIYHESILAFTPLKVFDFVLSKGVLIHINPNKLDIVYKKLYDSCKKYICLVEYYNPKPITVKYRGFSERLFKRDFAGEFMDKYSDLTLINYGFIYHRDNNFPQDDFTWFLLKK